MNADDAELLRRYGTNRDQEAFAELVRRYLDLVYFAALRQVGGDAHRAEDVAQTVFTLLAHKAGTLARHQALAGWLHTTTRFTAGRAMRTERRRLAREQEAHFMHELHNSSVSDHEWERLRPVIDEALGELSGADREAVLLRYFANQHFAEVGAKLKLSENSARMRVERALDKLQAVLAKRGVTSTSSALAAVLANQVSATTAPAGLAANVTGAALASADLAAASALGILQFMTTTKFVASAAAILVVLALGNAGYQVHAQREAQASLAAANQNHAALVARLRGLEQRANTTEQRAAELRQTVDAAEAKAAVDAAAAKAAGAWNPIAAGKAYLQRHPEVVQAHHALKDSWKNFSYGPLFKSLGLTPAQIEEFHALRRVNWQDTVVIDGKTAVLSYENPIPRSEVTSRLRTLLGDDGLAAYSRFEQDRPKSDARTNILLVASELCFTNTPLTPSQADQLVQAMSTNTRRVGAKPWEYEWDWDAINAKARDILSAAQQPAWKSVSTWEQGISANPTPAK